MPPRTDEIEITLFGPGFGECAVIHLGNNNWLVIDSCIDSQTGQPAALAYLHAIGVDPAVAVRLIIATHWHDDHIRGLSRLLAECKKARFCCSAALTKAEFLASVLRHEAQQSLAISSGVREIFKIYEELQQRPEPLRTPSFASANKRVLSLPADSSGHGLECEAWALSPSDKQVQKFLDELTLLMPTAGETKRRATAQSPNHLAVVTWITIGELALLFGADLEETKDPGTGWSVIVDSAERPRNKAAVFKIAHHGSENAHNDAVWREMLVPNAHAILSPYNRGQKKLPAPADIQRIMQYTEHAYISSVSRQPASRKSRPAAVNRTIRETVGKIRLPHPQTGWVTLRNDTAPTFATWRITLSPNACHLRELHQEMSRS